jgi:hypothetical protein
MALFFALHTPTGEPGAGWEFFATAAPALAAAMEAGRLPAKAITTWNPSAYGRPEYVFCLWEAEKPEDVMAVLRESGLADIVTTDLMQVDAIDWKELAKAAQ